MYNTIVAVGHLVQDPKIRHTNGGKSICEFRVCISDSKSNSKCFIDVETWEKLADVCSKFLKKGRSVLIEGELCTSSWDGQDGAKIYKTFIRGNTVKFMDGGNKEQVKPANTSANTATEVASQEAAASSSEVDEDIPF